MTTRRDIEYDVARSPSAALVRLFGVYLDWFLRRHFHGVRIANGSRLGAHSTPMIVYLNHASWWDPLTCMMLARRYFPGLRHYAPMDEAALSRYRIFGRMGMFPVEKGTRRGAAQFLRASTRILNAKGSMLWVTPQGAFSDVRQRPPVFKPGIAGLLKRNPRVIAIPLAIEYTFWDERLPEVLINVGQAQQLDASMPTGAVEERLTGALTSAQDALAALVASRNPTMFQTLISGHAGVGFAYDTWRRLMGLMHGKSFQPEHTAFQRQDTRRPEGEDAALKSTPLKEGGVDR